MKNYWIILTCCLLSGLFLNSLKAQHASSTPPEAAHPAEPNIQLVTFMHPESVYSFRGLDGKGFLKRKPINITEPAYNKQGTGIVILVLLVNPKGQVVRAKVEPGMEDLASPFMVTSAQNAVQAWTFSPTAAKNKQQFDEVRVIIQFNYRGSGTLYSDEGNVIIKGIDGRFPVSLPLPDYKVSNEGIVTAEATLSPDGSVAWIDAYYGRKPGAAVNPHLGVLTHEAISKWKFSALKEDMEQKFQSFKVICRYQHWSTSSTPPSARMVRSTP